MSDIEELIARVVKFRDERDWKQFHNPKDSAISLCLEAAEVLEHFQWKDKTETDVYLIKNKQEVSEELADVLYWVLLMCNDLQVDITKTFLEKLDKNGKKYPIEKSKGNHKKYTELEE